MNGFDFSRSFCPFQSAGGDDSHICVQSAGELHAVHHWHHDDSVPTSSDSTAFFLRPLDSYRAKAMPRVLVTLAKKVAENSTAAHLNDANVQRTEGLLANRILGTSVHLKSDPDVRKTVITILDALVNLGSTAAFFYA